jgi:hypothetical protein
VPFFDAVIAVVQRIGKMRRRPRSFSAADDAVIDNDNLFSCFCQKISRRQARNSAADNADIRLD